MTLLAESRVSHSIEAPPERIDLSRWVFSLRDDEYQACSRSHIAAGTGMTSDGRRMSINVERIAGNLLVQHYVEEMARPHHVRLNSLTDSYSALGDTKLEISWELTVRPIAQGRCEFTNHVVVKATPSFMQALAGAGQTDINAVTAQMRANLEAHNREETPLFARNIESKALKGAIQP